MQGHIARKDLKAADIVARIKCGYFETLAKQMEDKIGIPDRVWEKMDARRHTSSCVSCSGVEATFMYTVI